MIYNKPTWMNRFTTCTASCALDSMLLGCDGLVIHCCNTAAHKRIIALLRINSTLLLLLLPPLLLLLLLLLQVRVAHCAADDPR